MTQNINAVNSKQGTNPLSVQLSQVARLPVVVDTEAEQMMHQLQC